LTHRKSGRGTLKQYELTNLLFFLVLIVALGVLVAVVFNHYRTLNEELSGEENLGVVSESWDAASDVGVFYLGTKISETSRRYQSRIEIPVTDDGFLKELFSLPGVEEVSIDQRSVMLKKSSAARWEEISPGVHRIVSRHLHIHF
jgi:hypothetical protein